MKLLKYFVFIIISFVISSFILFKITFFTLNYGGLGKSSFIIPGILYFIFYYISEILVIKFVKIPLKVHFTACLMLPMILFIIIFCISISNHDMVSGIIALVASSAVIASILSIILRLAITAIKKIKHNAKK